MSFALPTGFDPSKMMEYLAKLPEEEQVKLLQGAMGQVGDYEQKAQASRTREGLIKRFKEARARFVRPGGIFAEEIARGDLSPSAVQCSMSNTDAKPSVDSRSRRSLKPMIGSELEVGTTHRGRYICGWVAIEAPFFGISSSSLLMEDVTGQLVEIAAYGLVDTELPAMERQYRLESKFPKGEPIIVFEPYFKVRQDLSEGIRIDQPKEMISWRDVPKDLSAWKKLGNEYFAVLSVKNGGRGALACYQRAIQAAAADVKAVAILLNNLATCRFKTEDYATAIQLAGAAVHLDPTYFKAWFRLASALVAYEPDEMEGETKRDTKAVAARVVSFARSAVPDATRQQLKALEGIVKANKPATRTDGSHFQSYAEWCAELESPGFVLFTEDEPEPAGHYTPAETRDADAWRKAGSEYFTKGDFAAAESCYRKGITASLFCCRDVSLVLNNVAAVHLMLHQDQSVVPGITVGGSDSASTNQDNQVPSTELALLNCSVAAIIDPLNHKAWARRARCLEKLGFTPEECITDLHTVRASVMTNAMSSTGNDESLQDFKRGVSTEIQKRSRQESESKPIQPVADVPTNIQREQRDALDPNRLAAAAGLPEGAEEEEDIDQYIARMEAFENMTSFAFAASKGKSKRQQKDMPREMEMFIKNKPPPFHTEFPKLRGWPDGIDSTFARKVLHRAYLDASANPWVMALTMREGAFFENMDPGDLVKRWHGTGALEILTKKGNSLRLGDIIDGREALKAVPEYDARIRSNFVNNPNRAEILFFGSTHVAIGFNDFSSLVSATLLEKGGNASPLRFVGFEMSEFAVAKCKVVAQMLGTPAVAISSVMEVWLSSTWSEKTLADFRTCVTTVLRSLNEHTENPKVLSYLNYWASAEALSAAKARSEFFSNLERYNIKAMLALGCFKREIDRLDLTQYMLTGEIRASDSVLDLVERERTGAATSTDRKKKKKAARATPLTGSLTMWNVPPNAPPLEEDIAFNTVDFMTLLEEYAKREKQQKRSVDRLSVVDLFVIHILQNLHRLRGLMLRNKLTIEVNYGVVKAVRGAAANDRTNRELLDRIALMRPYTISWSNVLDYFLPEDFHDLARRCSVFGDCMHYGYSMNWSTQVYGASIIDYSPQETKQVIDMALDTALGFKGEGKFGSSLDMIRMMGLDKLVSYPFREHPLNGTGYVLSHAYKEFWLDHFVKTGALSSKAKKRLGSFCKPGNSGFQKGTMDLGLLGPLYRTSQTLYLSWSYDPSLRMTAANNPFEMGEATDPALLEDLMRRMTPEERRELLRGYDLNSGQ